MLCVTLFDCWVDRLAMSRERVCMQCVTPVLLLQLCYCHPCFSTQFAFDNHRKMTATVEGEREEEEKRAQTGKTLLFTCCVYFHVCDMIIHIICLTGLSAKSAHQWNGLHSSEPHVLQQWGGGVGRERLWVRWKGQHTYIHIQQMLLNTHTEMFVSIIIKWTIWAAVRVWNQYIHPNWKTWAHCKPQGERGWWAIQSSGHCKKLQLQKQNGVKSNDCSAFQY